MASIDISRNYSNGAALLESDLDAIQSSLTTFFNTTKVNDDNIQTGGITASTKLINSSITTAKITDATVANSKINDSAVTTVKIADTTVSTANIADSAVTAAKIASSTIVNADFADNSITQAKRASAAYGDGSDTSSGSSGTPTSEVDVTGATVNITATGRPILVMLPGKAIVEAYLNTIDSSLSSPGTYHNITFRIYRDSTLIATSVCATGVSSASACTVIASTNTMWVIDSPASGATYTYKLTVQGRAGANAVQWYKMQLQAVEL